MGSFFSIPGNVKQSVLPFVINSSSKINQDQKSSDALKEAQPQLFSFRSPKTIGSYATNSNFCNINFLPNSFGQMLLNDISYKLLNNKVINSQSTLDKGANFVVAKGSILEAIPKIQIREFLPDPKLDQCINFFKAIMSAISSKFSKNESKSTTEKPQQISLDNFLKNISESTVDKIKKFFEDTTGKNSFAGSLSAVTDKNLEQFLKKDILNNNKGHLILRIPFLLYYKLQTSVTTNIYEVPGFINDKLLYTSDGTPGWKAGFHGDLNSIIPGGLKNIPIIGNIASQLFSNIGMHFMPWWDAVEGINSQFPETNIKFDLLNDTKEHAINNFLFVNTLIPNNQWIQYNVFRHSSDIYDIKFEGYQRLFACSGKFSVTFDGVLRQFTEQNIKELCTNHLNKNFLSDPSTFADFIIKNKIIKIPDVYHVSMVFTSLLPNTFNTFLFNYAANFNMLMQYSTNAYDESLFSKILTPVQDAAQKI